MRYQIFQELIDRGLITPAERMLLRRIMELDLENAQLKEIIEDLRWPAESVSQVRNQVDKFPARNVSNKNPVAVDLQPRQRDLPSDHEPTLEELCRPLSAKNEAKLFRL